MARQFKIISAKDLPNDEVFGRHLNIQNYRHYLGTTRKALFWDASNGLFVNAFSALIPTVADGGEIGLYLPDAPDPDHARLLDFGWDLSACRANFNGRLRQMVGDFQEKALSVNQHLNPQDIVLPAIIIGKRGRGKTTFLHRFSENRRCLWVAPFRSNVPAGVYHLPPDDALRWRPQVDYLLIDEASSIPAHQLIDLTKIYPNYLLSSSTDGYEGQAQILRLKTLPILAQRDNLNTYYFEQAFRFQAGDAVEQLCEALFLINPPENRAKNAQFYEWINPQDLTHSSLLSTVYGLLHQAHYRTTPEDLKRLLDLPNQKLLIARDEHDVAGVLHLWQETALPADLARAVRDGLRRPRGRLWLQQALFQTQNLDFNGHYWRVGRIVVAPQLRRMGIAKNLIQMAKKALSEPLVVSLAYREDLGKFWEALFFREIHRSPNNNSLWLSQINHNF